MSDNQPAPGARGAAEAISDPGSDPGSAPAADVLAQLADGTLVQRMGIVVTEASPDLVRGTMPVDGNTQPYGLLHGGASCVLAETLGSVGAAMHAARFDKIAVGIEINATHHRGATSGTVTGTATPVHLGGTLTTYEIVITDERDRRVCTARLSCMLRPAPPNA
jgi:1,4-dihydroxy-2-naphthoyl-CoA hydrolase